MTDTKIPIEIKAAQIHDAFEIFEIEKKSVTVNNWSFEQIKHTLKVDCYHWFTLCQKDQIIGYFCLIITDDTFVDLANICIKTKDQNKGFGSKLIEKIKNYSQFHQKTSILLEVATTNINAINFYKKHGFYQIDIKKNYYKNNSIDAIIMECRL